MITEMSIEDELKRDFVTYAKEINRNRAFPHLLPGIKPVAGHALWAMFANKRFFDRPYTKSAKIEGEVMSYSPHAGAYSSLARMAQDFVYHVPYLDGHGSFGSVVGGPTPGAARYTGLRMSEFIQDVLFYNTKLLDMGLNYLEEEEEPILEKWVALLPLLFITNTSGMGYTASNTWSSGNLYEFKDQLVNYLKTGKVDCSKVYPDFPTGGIIVNKSDIKSIYETGQGTIKLRGNTEIVGDTIRITSLPYQVYPEQFIEDVKKYVTNNQHTIKDVSNRCGKSGLLIEIECEPDTAEYTIEVLFKKTCLQSSISDEHKAVTNSGKPELITLVDYMKAFVDGNIEMVKREATLDLENILHRLEIVDGLLSALDIIDEIIAEIRSSKSQDDAKKLIMKNHGFTENQAAAIVGTTLGKLANLEKIKIAEEKKDLYKRRKKAEKLTKSKKDQEEYFLDRFNKLVEKYGWERKTQVVDIAASDIKVAKINKPAQLKPKKEFMVVLTENNCLKRIDVIKFRQTEEDNKNIKVQGNEKIIMVSNKGQMYKLFSNAVDKCLPTSAGVDISTLRELKYPDEKIIAIYTEDVDLPYIYFVTKNGLGKMSEVKNTLKLSKVIGTVVCGLKSEDDEVIAVKILNEGENISITTNKRTETITPDKCLGRGSSGKKVIYLKDDEEITEVHSC